MEKKKLRYKFRIKEAVALKNGDGKWFVPQIAIDVEETIGLFCWKKKHKKTSWRTFYKRKDGSFNFYDKELDETSYSVFSVLDDVVGFKTLDEARKFVESIDSKLYEKDIAKEEREQKQIVACLTNDDSVKYHELHETE